MPTSAFLAGKRGFPVFLVILFLFYSCTAKKDLVEEMKQMEQGLINSSKLISYSTRAYLKELEEKTAEPATAERASSWFPKAEHIAKLSRGLTNYIDSARIKFNQEKGISDSIYIKLVKYKEDILHIDPSITEQFQNSIEFSYLVQKPTTRTVLTVFQNYIKAIEYKIIAFCNTKVGMLDGDTYVYSSAIVGQNSRYFKAGDLLEISAGLGKYSVTGQPKVIIGGTSVMIGEDGYAIYTKKVQANPGTYKIPVSISYFDQRSGKEELSTMNVEYTVAKECDQ